MSLKIFHTADLHIGLKFTRGYETDVRSSLINARFEVLRNMIGLANDHACDLFVIAGDLFDNSRVEFSFSFLSLVMKPTKLYGLKKRCSLSPSC